MAAELHGKLSPFSPLSDRSEDLLTSHMLSLFRYLDSPDLCSDFLASAVDVLSGAGAATPRLRRCEVHFWPGMEVEPGYVREADALIAGITIEGRSVVILVEAKYLSGLSNREEGSADHDNGEADDEEDLAAGGIGDQLVDEYRALLGGRCLRPETEVLVRGADVRAQLYVTASHQPPLDDLARVAAVARSRGGGAPAVWWSSWRRLHTLLARPEASAYAGSSAGAARMLVDARRVLEGRDLVEYQPFRPAAYSRVALLPPLVRFGPARR